MSDFDLDWKGDEFFAEVQAVNTQAMKKAALVVERAAKKIFGTGASRPDASFRRGKKQHRPSSAGFPPNIDTGILKSSVTTKIGRASSGEVEGFVGSDIVKIRNKLTSSKKNVKDMRTAVEYGFFLEVGTKNMRPRPWLRPALRKSGDKILRIFRKANS